MFSLVPSPSVVVYPNYTVLAFGSRLSLSCSISQSLYVDTPTTTSFNWTTPDRRYDRVKYVSNYSEEFVIENVETADSGNYVCSVIVYDYWGEFYIIESEVSSGFAMINVSK